MEDSGIDSDPKPIQEERLGGVVIGSLQTSDSSCSSTSVPSPQRTNLKQLHRKLERRIEQAKKVQRLQEYKRTAGLIPIQRLPIPSKSPALTSNKEHHPLVDWDTDESEEDINFFPVKVRDGRQELTDTFSIENMPLSGGEEDEDDLDLLPPQTNYLAQTWNECLARFHHMEIRERVVPSTSFELMEHKNFTGVEDSQVVPTVPEPPCPLRRNSAREDAEVPDKETRRVPTVDGPRRHMPLDEFLRALALECDDPDGPQVVPIVPASPNQTVTSPVHPRNPASERSPERGLPGGATVGNPSHRSKQTS